MNKDIKKAFVAARRQFPHTKNITYLNSASYGPLSIPVRRAVEKHLDTRMSATYDDTAEIFKAADDLRTIYARFLGASKREVGIGLNTSFGLNLAAFGLPLKTGDEILISDTEFPATIYIWREAATVRGLSLKKIPSRNLFFDIQALEKSITKRTRVISISYVYFYNGFKNDLRSIGELCRRHDLYFVVDGIQGVGTQPIDVHKCHIDILACGCHKWMLAPEGGGFFYLSDRIRDRLTPTHMSWQSADWKLQYSDLFRYDLPLFDSARRFELGYYATGNILGMRAAADFFVNLGIRNIQRHNRQLLDRLADYISQYGFYTITNSMVSKHRSSILTFTCPGIERLHEMLNRKQIAVSLREGSIRVSVHLFNNERDIDLLIEQMDSFARTD